MEIKDLSRKAFDIHHSAFENAMETVVENGGTYFDPVDLCCYASSVESLMCWDDDIASEDQEALLFMVAQEASDDEMATYLLKNMSSYISVPFRKINKLFLKKDLRAAKYDKYDWIVENTFVPGGKGVQVLLQCNKCHGYHIRNTQDVFQSRVCRSCK